jgi:hypothetical protein
MHCGRVTRVKVKDACLESRRPLQRQNQLQRRPAEAGRYKCKTNCDGRRRKLFSCWFGPAVFDAVAEEACFR